MRKGEFLDRVKRICECGKEFEVRQKRIDDGRGKFCSSECRYKFRKMPKRGKGTYVLVKENPTWIKSGTNPWNKGRTDLPRPVNFKDSGVGYWALHDWVNRHKGKATKCEECGKDAGRIEWANISHEYKRDLTDWKSLCKKCHIKYDRENGWGEATIKFSLPKRQKK